MTIMCTELSMETRQNHGDAQDSRRAAAASPLRGCLLVLLQLAGKLAAPMAVVAAALLGYSLQGSLTVSPMPGQGEDPDATLRARMFKPISERLFGAKSNAGDLAPAHKTVFTELPASNVHERSNPDADQELLEKQAKLGGSAGERAGQPPTDQRRKPTAFSRRRTSTGRPPPPARRRGPAAG
jgi:hypothetical protein